jgi:transposase InsO family protein
MTIETFAKRFRVKIVRDECGDQIIEGRRGHLYFDGNELCLMAIDTLVAGMSTEAIQGLGGKCWIGDIWRDAKNRGYRDVKVQGIPEANWKPAVKLCRARTRRVLSEERKAVLRAQLKRARLPENPPLSGVESRDEAR